MLSIEFVNLIKKAMVEYAIALAEREDGDSVEEVMEWVMQEVEEMRCEAEYELNNYFEGRIVEYEHRHV